MFIAEHDPMGLAIQEYHKHVDTQGIIHVFAPNDAGYNIPAKLLFRDYAQMPLLERKALDACKGSVLDIGAGAGSHSLVLQERGHEVTALDISPLSVKIIKERGVEQAVCSNIYDYEGGPFNTLLMLMNGIGLVGTLEGLKQFLEHAKTLLSPGGQILLDSTDVLYLYEDDEDSYVMELEGGRYYGEVVYEMEYKGTKSKPFSWLYVDFLTLTQYALDHGFDCELVCEGKNFHYLARLVRLNNH